MSIELVRYDNMCRAIAAAHAVDEVKDIRDKALALKLIARTEDARRKFGELTVRAERRCGELIRQGQADGTIATAKGEVNPSTHKVSSDTTPSTLSELGVTRDQSSRFQKLADIPQEDFEQVLSESEQAPTAGGILNARKSTGSFHVSQGNDEWYTPEEYITAARDVMGGIDLDPASCLAANNVVRANSYFTKEDSGLDKQWFGRVWLNPPFSMPLIKLFADKLISERANIDQAIVITNNATDTQWFHALLELSGIICLMRGRAKFYSPDSEVISARQGQVIFYFGENRDEFARVFCGLGAVMKR